MTFKEYIHKARLGTDYARADFIRDARADPAMPDDFSTEAELVSFLTYQHRACAEAIDGARSAWRTYQALQRRRPAEPNLGHSIKVLPDHLQGD